MNNHNHGVH